MSSSPWPGHRRDGFAGQRLCVVPRPQVEAALRRPVTRRVTVTDAGYFPLAAGHRRVRPEGADEAIVLMCVAGGGSVSISGERHELRFGSSIVIPAATPHAYEALSGDPWTIWWFHARGTDVSDLSPPTGDGTVRVTRIRALDRVVALFDELVGLLERRTSPAQLLAAAGVACHLLTRIAADSVLPADGSPLERAMLYLRSRVDGAIAVPELAALVGLSPSHLSAQFRQATGGGPAAYLTSLKMARARMLLDTTGMGVAEVAAQVGYSDSLYFSRHFRRVHGVSPTTYRAQHKG